MRPSGVDLSSDLRGSSGAAVCTDQTANNALHWTGIPLRCIPASELSRWADGRNFAEDGNWRRLHP